MRKYLLIFLLLCLIPLPALNEEEESFSMPTSEDVAMSGANLAVQDSAIHISLPKEGQTYEAGGKLTVKATCDLVEKMVAVLENDVGTQRFEQPGTTLEHVFDTTQFTTASTLTISGVYSDESGEEMAVSTQIVIISPRDKLIADMFALAKTNSTQSLYRHAPAQTDTDRGVCKNFVMRLFDTYAGAYRMAQYPDLALHMPKNKSKKDSAPYQYGIEWRDEDASDGSPFYIAAQYKYDDTLTKEENTQMCREVLHSVQRGDFFQMCGDYYYGNGPHSLLFMEDYDPQTDLVTWTDSNMKGDRVDGARWGYLQYNVQKEAEWFVEAISVKSTYKTRGCTIYRLRDDLFVQ